MMVIATGRATPDQVWNQYLRPATWARWAPHISSVECDDEIIANGTIGRVVGPGGVGVDFEVEEVDPVLRSWTWRVGRGRMRVRLRHDVVPTGDSLTMATMRLDGPLATVLQPYRLLSVRAQRGLVSDTSSPPPPGPKEVVVRVPFAFSPAHRAEARMFAVTPDNSWIDVGPQWLLVRYGPWSLLTPRSNVSGHQISEDFAFIKTAGPPHLSLKDQGVSFTPNGARALCVRFHEPVAAIDPTGILRHPAATFGVARPEALAAVLDGARPRT